MLTEEVRSEISIPTNPLIAFEHQFKPVAVGTSLKQIETVETNILGNVHVLEACRVNNVKRFIYGSTVYVYSREGNFYRCSKQAAEGYVEEYRSAYNLDYTILRYGSLY